MARMAFLTERTNHYVAQGYPRNLAGLYAQTEWSARFRAAR